MNNSDKKKGRIQLPGGCSISTPSIFPKDWKRVAASCKREWYIQYRFYDPGNKPSGKQRIIKGMNEFKTPRERSAATQRLLDDELSLLHQGYNIVTRTWSVANPGMVMDKFTPLPRALADAVKSCSCAEYTKRDINGMMHWIPLAIGRLHWEHLPVSEIRTSHIRVLLDACSQIKSRLDLETGKLIQAGWSEHKFNKYRSYLMILFAEIIELGGAEMNPCRELRKKKTVRKVRKTLTIQQRQTVNRYLRKIHYGYWRFLHIFFHSGARETEILMVQAKHVDLQNQTFTRLVKKDRGYREVRTTIKDVALPLWREALLKFDRETGEVVQCGAEDYIFSRGFVPGSNAIKSPTWISVIWLRLIKRRLGVTADFYSLKHSNTTETRKLAGAEVAAEQNAQKGTAMVLNIYDVDRASWMHEQQKKVNNPFA